MHKDLYRARAAALSMIPTSTGAAKAVGLVHAGTQGQARRHFDPRADAERLGGRSQVHRQARHHGRGSQRRDQGCRRSGPLKGILGFTDKPNVSIDFNHDPHSSIFHLDQTKVMDGNFVSILSWYDNEWGFSNRMSDTAVHFATLI